MPWTVDDPPPPAKNWTADEKSKCVAAANAALERGNNEQDAIFACIGAAGKGEKAMTDENQTPDEGEKGVQRPTQAEVNYVTLSVVEGQACANCRWFSVHDEMGDDSGYCHLIEGWPEAILPTGWCDRWEVKPGMPEPKPVPVVVVGEAAKEEDEPTEETEVLDDTYTYLVPKMGIVQSLKGRLAGVKPGQTVFRDTDGRRYMFIVTSNSYEDTSAHEVKTIASKALQRYVDSCWVADDYFKSNNVHQIWHHDGLTVGDIVWADMSGPFLLEISKERDDIISKVAWDYMEGAGDLGASHRFLYRRSDVDDSGTLPIMGKWETTTLPRSAAANLLTYSGVIPMSKERDAYLDDMFGVEGVAALLKDGPEKLAEKLAEAGHQHKSNDEPTPEEAVENAATNFSAMLLKMVEAQAEQGTQLATLITALDDQNKAVGQKMTDESGRLDAVLTRLDTLEAALKEAPRASEAPETVVTDEAAKQAVIDQTTTYDPMFPGMNVPMEG